MFWMCVFASASVRFCVCLYVSKVFPFYAMSLLLSVSVSMSLSLSVCLSVSLSTFCVLHGVCLSYMVTKMSSQKC